MFKCKHKKHVYLYEWLYYVYFVKISRKIKTSKRKRFEVKWIKIKKITKKIDKIITECILYIHIFLCGRTVFAKLLFIFKLVFITELEMSIQIINPNKLLIKIISVLTA